MIKAEGRLRKEANLAVSIPGSNSNRVIFKPLKTLSPAQNKKK
jgi:hypothetical protein